MKRKLYNVSLLYLKNHSPTILTFLGVCGVIATTVLAVQATPKAINIIEDRTKEKGEKLSVLETIQVAGPLYIPTIVSGISTISCIFGVNILNDQKQKSLAYAYTLLNQSYQRYRKSANSIFGEDADSKIIVHAAKEAYVSADGYYLYSPDLDHTSEKILFYDNFTNRYFTSTMSTVLNAQYHLNRNLSLRGEVCLNEFYSFLGLEDVDCGYGIGWSWEDLAESGYVWLDFENIHTKMEDGIECYIITSAFEPLILYPEND